MSERNWVILASAIALTACNGKSESAATPAVDSTAVAPAIVDSVHAPAADSGAKALVADTGVKRVDSTTKAAPGAAAPKVETGDYDKAVRPRFKINEKTGKIDTIRKP